MSDKSGDEPENPFKGTPFEHLFGGGGMPDLNALLGQMQSMMTPHAGPVNWTLAEDIARRTAAEEKDPTPSQRDHDAFADAIRLADLWLDDTTNFSSGVTSTAAWSRAEWIAATLPHWKVLVEPVAENIVGAMGSALPQEAQAMAGPLAGIFGQLGGAMFGSQVGQALGGLAAEVLSTSEVGLPMGPSGRAAMLPTNVRAFAEGLDASYDDVVLYFALREAAYQRLFAQVSWLHGHLTAAISDYARGLSIDLSGIESQLGSINPMDPAAVEEALSGGLFEPKRTPAQEAALQRLETTLALVEGWVDEVVGQATSERMPAAAKLQEAMRRRRAAGGPAEQTFAALVGLELRPRRLRDASTLWGSLRSRQGIEARDGVWLHPDLLPTAADLDDPLGFREGQVEPVELDDADFDAALRQLLDGGETGNETGETGDEPDDAPGTSA